MMAQSIGSVVCPAPPIRRMTRGAGGGGGGLRCQGSGAASRDRQHRKSSHPGVMTKYRYDLDMIGHDPHELAAYLSAVLQGYTRQSAQAELEARVFDAQYQLTLTEEVEIRYRTETSTDPVTGETTTEEVPYEYYILNVKLTSKPISSVASELLTPEQLEMYQVYRQTLGQQAADLRRRLPGYEQLRGPDRRGIRQRHPPRQSGRGGHSQKSGVGNVGGSALLELVRLQFPCGNGAPASCPGATARWGLSEPRFAACPVPGYSRGFQSHGQWGGRDYANIAPGDAIFFDWGPGWQRRPCGAS